MKGTLLTLILGLTCSASAQVAVNLNSTGCTGGVSGTTTAGNDANNIARCSQHNAEACGRKGLALSCTQAQLDAVTGCASGACGTIYANTSGTCTGAGALAFSLSRFLGTTGTFATGEGSFMDLLSREITKVAQADANKAWQTNKDTIAASASCTAAGGLAAGCTTAQVVCYFMTLPSGAPRYDCKLP